MGAEDTANENLELIRRHYAAFGRGDVDGMMSALTEDVCIEVNDERGKSVGEPRRGLEAARSFFEDIKSSVVHTTVAVESLRADGDRVLARVTLGGTLRQTGMSGQISAVHLFTIRDGRIGIIRTHRPNWQDPASAT